MRLCQIVKLFTQCHIIIITPNELISNIHVLFLCRILGNPLTNASLIIIESCRDCPIDVTVATVCWFYIFVSDLRILIMCCPEAKHRSENYFFHSSSNVGCIAFI